MRIPVFSNTLLCVSLTLSAPGAPMAQSHAPLFDGASLKGWTTLGDGAWSVANGEISAKQLASKPRFTHLVHDTVVKDFRLSFLFQSAKGNAGFFFRLTDVGTDPEKIAGVQVVIDPALQSADAFGLYETGGREWVRKWDFAKHRNQYPNSVNCMMKWDSPILSATQGIADTNCRKTLYNPGNWNRISVWAKGPRVIVKLNMRTIVDTVDAKLDHAGRFAFKLHGGQDVEIKFKDVELSPLAEMPAGLVSNLKRALLYKGEAGVSPAQLREFVKEVATENGIALDEGVEGDFNTQNLAKYQAALFLSDYNVNFNAAQRTAFEAWFKQDHGAACMHACTRQEVSMAWPWWGDAVGAKLATHTSFKERSVSLDGEAAKRPLWKGFDAKPLRWRDEWFWWVQDPRGKPGVTVLLSYADDAGPQNDQAVKGLPHTWIKESQGGRFFASGAMHTMNSLELPFTYDFILNALRDVGGYDTVAIAVKPRAADLKPAWSRAGGDLILRAEAGRSVKILDLAGKSIFAGKSDGEGSLVLPAREQPGIRILAIEGPAGWALTPITD